MIIHSKVTPKFKRKQIFKASAIAMLAVFFLLITALFAPLDLLKEYGLFVPLLSIAMVTYAMNSYKKVKLKEQTPETLCFSKEALIFSSGGTAHFLLPMALVQSVKFVSTHKEYGIAITLSVPWKEHVFLKNPTFSLQKFHKKGKAYAADLFFPFFTKEGCQKIHKILFTKPYLQNVMHTDDTHNLGMNDNG
jgi:hypothetical protein